MTIFDRTWDTTYEAVPADNEDINDGALRIRNLKVDIHQREAVDHAWAGDADDGKHNHVTLRQQTSAPIVSGGDGSLFTRLYGGINELFYKDSAGTITQLTFNGVLYATEAPANFTVLGDAIIHRAEFAGIANFFIDKSGSNPVINFDASTFIMFDTVARKFLFYVDGVQAGSFPP